jgi:hypothetical protein
MSSYFSISNDLCIERNLYSGVFVMKYRDIEYSVFQDAGGDIWKWAVDLDEATSETGQRKTRDTALTAVVLTVDRWLARRRRIESHPHGDAGHIPAA